MNPDGDGRSAERRLREALATLGDVPSPAGDLAGGRWPAAAGNGAGPW